MNFKETNRGQIRGSIERDWSVGRVESLFEAAQRRMGEKIVRGGYLSRRDGAEYTDEFREKLLKEGGLKLFAGIENQFDDSLMLFFNVNFMPGKVMQVSRSDQGKWQALLVGESRNSLGGRVIEAEKVDENLLCIDNFDVEPEYDQQMHYNFVKRDGRKAFEWKLVWSKSWRDIKEDKAFRRRLVELNGEIGLFRNSKEVEGY